MSFQPHLVTPMLKRPRITNVTTPGFISNPTPIKSDILYNNMNHSNMINNNMNINHSYTGEQYYKQQYEQQLKLVEQIKLQHESYKSTAEQKYSDTVQSLQSCHNKLRFEIDELKLNHESYTNKLQSDIDKLTTSNIDLQQKIKYLYNKNIKLQDEKLQSATEYIEDKHKLELHIDELKQQLRSTQNGHSMSSNHSINHALNTSITQLHSDIDYTQLQHRYDTLRSQYDGINTTIQQYMDENNQLRSRINEVNDIEQRYIELQQQYNTLQIQCDKQHISDDNQSIYKQNSDKYVELQQTYQKLLSQYNTLNNKKMNILLLNEKLVDTTDKYNVLQQKYDAIQKQFIHLDTEYNESINQFKQLLPDMKSLNDITIQIQQYQANELDTIKQLHCSKQVNNQLNTQIKLLTDLIDAYKSLDPTLPDKNQFTRQLNELYEQYSVLVVQHNNNTKILHLADNPLMNAITMKYRNKINELQSRLQQYNDNAANTTSTHTTAAATINHMDTSNVTSEYEAYKAESDKKFARLRSIFNDKVTNFREFVYLTSGYKIELLDNNIYKLQSMYFDQSSDYILFQCKLNILKQIQSIELLQSNCSNTIDKNVMMYLNKLNSIPAFLAALTLDLFDKQTKMIA